jgi:hypothetical protein
MTEFNGNRLANIGDPIYDKDGVNLRSLNQNFIAKKGGVVSGQLTTASLSATTISANTISPGQLILSGNTVPNLSGDTGSLGEIRFDSDYIYMAVATNTWKRTALSGW